MPDAVRDRLLDAHRPTLEAALAAAETVAAGWEGTSTTDRTAVVEPYRSALRGTNVLEALLAAHVEAVTHAGFELAARPVADVPYLAVTGQGVVLRTPVAGGRIVATLRAFEVAPYRLGPGLPEALVVERRGR